MIATMQTGGFPGKAEHNGVRMDGKKTVRVVIAYGNLASGRRAMSAVASLGLTPLGDEICFRPRPWSFDLLANTGWNKDADEDADSANILVIATTAANPLPPAVTQWVLSAIRRKQGTSAAVLALVGGGNDSNPAASRWDAIQTAALESGLAFFAPAPDCEWDVAIANIHQRAAGIPSAGESMDAPQAQDIPGASPQRIRANEPGLRILYVEDDIELRNLAGAALRGAGYAVDTADDGEEGWAALRDGSYHLLITDNRMPRLTGVELIQKLCRAGIPLPVILASSAPPFSDEACLDRCDAVVEKPFTAAQLLGAVREVLATANAGQLGSPQATP